MNIQIVPAILTDSIDHFEDRLSIVEGFVDRVQIDYVDGFFSPEVSCCEAKLIRSIDTDVSLEVQLMVVDPISQVDAWADAGVDRIIGHIEEMDDQVAFVEKVSGLGLNVGLALNLETHPREMELDLIKSIDVVLLMAHEVGVGGEDLDPAIYKKIEYIRDLNDDIDIEVDGGVSLENAHELVKAGANVLAAGSAIFDAKDPRSAIEELLVAAQG